MLICNCLNCNRHCGDYIFINFAAYFHPALQFISIKFVVVLFCLLFVCCPEMELPFLDITLRISDARIQISVYYTHNYLNLTSFYPHHCKHSIPYSQFLRLCCLYSNGDDSLLWSRQIDSPFTDRGYSRSSPTNYLQRVATIIRPDTLHHSLRLRNMLVYSTDHSFTEQPSASTMQKLQSHQSRRCDTRP